MEASQRSWMMYFKKLYAQSIKDSINGTNQSHASTIPVRYSRQPLSWPGLNNRRPDGDKHTPSPTQPQTWEDRPWSIDITGFTCMMKLYGQEINKGLTIIGRPVEPQHQDKDRVKGWAGHQTHHSAKELRTEAPELRYRAAVRSALALHQQVMEMEAWTTQSFDQMWLSFEREYLHPLGVYSSGELGHSVGDEVYTNRLSFSSPPGHDLHPQGGLSEQTKQRILQNLSELRQVSLSKLHHRVPIPDKSYFNAMLNIFGRFDGMANRGIVIRRPMREQGGDEYFSARYRQWKGQGFEGLEEKHSVYDMLKEDMEKFGYQLPSAYLQRSPSQAHESHPDSLAQDLVPSVPSSRRDPLNPEMRRSIYLLPVRPKKEWLSKVTWNRDHGANITSERRLRRKSLPYDCKLTERRSIKCQT